MRFFLQTLFGVFVKPSRLSRRIIARKPMVTSVLMVLLAVAGTVVYGPLTGAPVPVEWTDLLARFGVRCGIMFAGLFLAAGLLHLSADLMGGGGSGAALLALLCIGTAPLILLAPIGLLLHSIGLSVIGWIPTTVDFVIMVWMLVLYLVFIKETYRFKAGKALLTMLLPLCVMLFVMVLGALRVLFAHPAVPFV
ncbi:YIP1 family protein [bacterium]|nr:YIP1 family protein [candidate division CSSED10-310 bacterium]